MGDLRPFISCSSNGGSIYIINGAPTTFDMFSGRRAMPSPYLFPPPSARGGGGATVSRSGPSPPPLAIHSHERRNLWNCPECGFLVDKGRHMRICMECSEGKDIVTLEGDDNLGLNAADYIFSCSHCALEGFHKGHSTILYSTMKFKQQTEGIVADCEALTTGCFEQIINVKMARENLLSSLEMIASSAETKTDEEMEQSLGRCEEVKMTYESVIKTLEGEAQTAAETIEDLVTLLRECAPVRERQTPSGRTSVPVRTNNGTAHRAMQLLPTHPKKTVRFQTWVLRPPRTPSRAWSLRPRRLRPSGGGNDFLYYPFYTHTRFTLNKSCI